MPWLGERTQMERVLRAAAQIRRYEPGVGEGAGVEVVETVEVVEAVQIVEVERGHGRPRLVGAVKLVVPLERGRDREVHGHGLVGQHGGGLALGALVTRCH